MRSALPKVLHPLCGRPLILWPVAAAQEAGAGKVVVVDNPKRRLEDRLPEGVAIADPGAAERHRGRGRRGRRAHRRRRDRRRDQRRRAADHRRGDRRSSSRPTRTAAPPGRWPRWSSTTRRSYGRVVRDKEGNVERVVETKAARATRRPSSSRSARSTPASTRSTAPRCSRRSTQLDTDNAQGELYLPDVLPELASRARRSPRHVVTDPTLTLGVNDRVELAQVRKLAQRRINERHSAQRRDDRRPRQHADRRRRDDRARHRRRARARSLQGQHADRRGLRRRPAARR